MGIFQQALDALPSTLTGDVEKIKALCDQILSEEKKVFTSNFGEVIEFIPRGANIFLALPAPARINKDHGVLTLERELGNIFVAVLYTCREKEKSFKKQRLWEIKETSPEKILTEYAKIYKYLEGK